jgi:hypothetical protein
MSPPQDDIGAIAISGRGHQRYGEPDVLGIGAVAARNSIFLYHETLLKRTVAFEILTHDRAWHRARTRRTVHMM